jgi:hypothetical protein
VTVLFVLGFLARSRCPMALRHGSTTRYTALAPQRFKEFFRD